MASNTSFKAGSAVRNPIATPKRSGRSIRLRVRGCRLLRELGFVRPRPSDTVEMVKSMSRLVVEQCTVQVDPRDLGLTRDRYTQALLRRRLLAAVSWSTAATSAP